MFSKGMIEIYCLAIFLADDVINNKYIEYGEMRHSTFIATKKLHFLNQSFIQFKDLLCESKKI